MIDEYGVTNEQKIKKLCTVEQSRCYVLAKIYYVLAKMYYVIAKVYYVLAKVSRNYKFVNPLRKINKSV